MRLLGSALVMMMLLAACSREEAPPAQPASTTDAEAVAALSSQRDAILAKRDSLNALEAKWNLGDTSSSVKGFFDGESLALIEEEMNMGEFGNARSRYVYSPKGNLLAYSEEKEIRTGARTGSPRVEQVKLSLLFAENGNLLQGERLVDGSPAELTGLEQQGVKLHARELELALQEKRAAGRK